MNTRGQRNTEARPDDEWRGYCETCKAYLYVEPGTSFDVAVHDCETDEWTLLRLPDGADG